MIAFNRKTKIIGAIVSIMVIGGGVTAIVLVNRKKRLAEFNSLMSAIKNNTNITGTSADLSAKGAAFDDSIYINNPSAASITKDQADTFAKSIYGDYSELLPDNRAGVVAIFKQLKNKTDVSAISASFYTLYQQDLFTYLDNFMHNNALGDLTLGLASGHDYMTDINNIVNELN